MLRTFPPSSGHLAGLGAIRGVCSGGQARCNVPHTPDLRTANYAPEFPPICRLPSPFSSVTTTASAVYVTAAVFTVSTAAVSTASTATAVFTATAVVSVYSASASDKSLHSVSSVRPWSYHLLAPFPQSVMNT
jgi:hypothetical protein